MDASSRQTTPNSDQLNIDLSGQTAFVTGAASGIGAAIALAFARSGAKVWVVDRDRSGAEATADRARVLGAETRVMELDITDQIAVARIADQCSAENWAPTVLVNNAGIGSVGTILETNPDQFDQMFGVNVRGLYLVTKALIPLMIARQAGNIINLASIGGVVGIRDRFTYCATKFAVVGMTKAMALDHAKDGIRVNCICPGRVETPFVAARIAEYADPQAARAEMSATQLAGRMVQPEEVATAAVYLASDAAAMITGTTFMIDSGWSAGK